MQFLNKLITFGFQLTKNIPIDNRFRIKNIGTVDVEIPQGLRYEGLIFSAEDTLTDYQGNNRRFYTFEVSKENGKLVPVLLFDYLNRRVKLGITITSEEIPNLNKILNENCYPVLGTTVYVSPLDIIVQWNGTEWKTICGTIKLTSEDEYNSLEDNFKNQGWVVEIGETKNIILDNLKLSDQIIIGTADDFVTYGGVTYQYTDKNFWENNKEYGRFFLLKNTLYYNFNGKLFEVNKQIYVKSYDNVNALPEVIFCSSSTIKFTESLSPKIYLVWMVKSNDDELKNYFEYSILSSYPEFTDSNTNISKVGTLGLVTELEYITNFAGKPINVNGLEPNNYRLLYPKEVKNLPEFLNFKIVIIPEASVTDICYRDTE